MRSTQSNTPLQVEDLEPRMMLSTVDIIAAGTTNQEIIELEIGGQTVASFSDLGTGAFQDEFQTRSFTTPDRVTADDVVVRFTNDLFDEATGADRNVRIDAIVIDGVRFETEDSSVFSTGTFLNADGIQPGFGRGDILHANGLFQFAGGGGNSTSITVNARGDVGTESFALQIDGETVQVFENINTNFTSYNFEATGNITADQIRVVFLNDQFDPDNGIDSNLIVDDIVVGGDQFETEAANVFSSGTFLSEDGIVAGFGRGDTLHVNGFFEFSSDVVNEPAPPVVESPPPVAEPTTSITVNARGIEGTESFALQIDGETVQTFENIGTDLSSFNFEATGNVTADQIRVVFLNDEFDPDNGIDSNLVVDNIVVDGAQFETEDPSVFSSGTFLPEDGFVEGFGRGDTLGINGFFDFGGQGASAPTAPVEEPPAPVEEPAAPVEEPAAPIQEPAAPVLSNGDGLFAEYFLGTNFDTFVRDGVESTVDFDFGRSSPEGLPDDNFSIRFTGQIEPLFSETYTFETTSDDGIRLFVNGELIIDNFTNHRATVDRGTIELEAGVRYDIRLEYFENSGDSIVQLRWSSASQALETISQSQLYSGTVETPVLTPPVVEPPTTPVEEPATPVEEPTTPVEEPVAPIETPVLSSGDGLLAEYFLGTNFDTFVREGVESTVDFEFGRSSPEGLPDDNFSIRFTGQVEPLFTETYTFETTSDDGIRLFVDGELIIDNFTDHGAQIDRGTIELEAGVRYDIRLEYYERGGNAIVQLRWSSASQALETISQSQLYSGTVEAPVVQTPVVEPPVTPPATPGPEVPTASDGRVLVTYFVSPNGSDSVNEEQAQDRTTPFQTIQRAVDAARAGDTVIVLDGTYNEEIFLAHSGNAGEEITIRSENQEGARLLGFIHGREISYVTVEGFDVTNSSEGVITTGIVFFESHHITLRNNLVRDSFGGGIAFNQSDSILIEGNTTHSNAFFDPDAHSGISIFQPQRRENAEGEYGIIIRNNLSFNNFNLVPNVNCCGGNLITDGNGIVLDDYQNSQQREGINGTGIEYDRRTLVENNITHSNGGNGIHVFRSHDIDIRNNTSVGNVLNLNAGAQINVQTSRDVNVFNNIASAGPGENAVRTTGSPNVTLEFNLIDGPEVGFSNVSTNIFAEPDFVNGTFELRAVSDAVDQGRDIDDAFATDALGQDRIVGTIDIGAVERQS